MFQVSDLAITAPDNFQVISFSSCISACEKGCSWQSALALLGMAKWRHLHPNLVTFNSAIRACVSGMPWEGVRWKIKNHAPQIGNTNTYEYYTHTEGVARSECNFGCLWIWWIWHQTLWPPSSFSWSWRLAQDLLLMIDDHYYFHHHHHHHHHHPHGHSHHNHLNSTYLSHANFFSWLESHDCVISSSHFFDKYAPRIS